MKFIYTYHAQNKFVKEKYVFQLKITKSIVQKIVREPQFVDRSRGEKITALAKFDANHSLVVVYTRDGDIIKVITFYPIKSGGKYEGKILQN